MPCIFCGKPGLSREHIYSRAWIERLVPHATGFTNTRAAGEYRAVPLNTWESRDMDVVVRCVCADCNNTWMNQLDAQVEAMVSTLCRGEVKVRIEHAALSAFATWAVKMALVIEGLMTPMVVRQDLRESFRHEQTPPTGVRVWVATMEEWDGEVRTTPMTLRRRVGESEVDQAYLATFRVLHLVVQVLVPLDASVQPEHDDWGVLHSELAWPRADTLEWPLSPERMLKSEADCDLLARSFRVSRE